VRILLLAPHPFYIDRGTPIDVDLVLRALSRRGADVDVLTYHIGEDVAYPGVTLHRIPRLRHVTSLRPGPSIGKLACDAYLLREALRMSRRKQYDVIHAGEEAVFIAMLCKWLHGTPYVYDMDSSIAQQVVEALGWLRPLAPLLNWFEARAIRGGIAALPVCNALGDLARHRGARHVEVLHDISQLTDSAFIPFGLRAQLGIAGEIVMYVGNLEPYQGVDLLLESAGIAMTAHSSFTLVIAGGDAQAIAAYTRKAERLGIAERTRFLGPWPADRLGALLAEADILTAPRIRGINTPMKVFPYLHSGKPLLATDLPTHTQILDQSVALLAAPDPASFAAGMLRLLDDRELRIRLGAAGRAFVEEGHTFAAYEVRLNRLYDHVEAVLNRGRESQVSGR